MASPELVGHVVDVMAEKYNWPLVDELDEQGNTALHVAAQADRHDVIGQLSPVNPTVLNKDGDNPLHVAAKRGHWKTLEVGKPKAKLSYLYNLFPTPMAVIRVVGPKCSF